MFFLCLLAQRQVLSGEGAGTVSLKEEGVFFHGPGVLAASLAPAVP